MRRTLTKQSSTSEDACTGMIWVGRALARAAAGQVSPRARLLTARSKYGTLANKVTPSEILFPFIFGCSGCQAFPCWIMVVLAAAAVADDSVETASVTMRELSERRGLYEGDNGTSCSSFLGGVLPSGNLRG